MAFYKINMECSGTTLQFENNSATTSGGAIASVDSTFTSNTKHLSFTANRAREFGGAYLGQVGSLTLGNQNHYFADNYAGKSGGAICFHLGSLNIAGNSSFENNSIGSASGGAIQVLRGNLTLAGRSVFANNHAHQYQGGAMAVYESRAVFEGTVLEFADNFANISGGAIDSSNSNITSMTKHLSFSGNSAPEYGGAYYGTGSILILGETEEHRHNFTANTAGRFGGAIHHQYGRLKIRGNTLFESNSGFQGGAINLLVSYLSLSGSAAFTNNHAHTAGAITLVNSSAIFRGTLIEFVNNTAEFSGGGIGCSFSQLQSATERLRFVGNSAFLGGAIASVEVWKRFVIASVTFTNNTAECGGAMHLYAHQGVYHNITATGNSASALCVIESNLTIGGSTLFKNNVGEEGGAIRVESSTMLIRGYTEFENNRAKFGGGAISSSRVTTLLFTVITLFTSNTATHGGAVYASESHITIDNVVNLTSNSAENGGALYFQSGATLTVRQWTALMMSFNHASKYGGAIYHRDQVTLTQCMFEYDEENLEQLRALYFNLPRCFMNFKELSFSSSPYLVQSTNDSAGEDGGFLYGGLIDKCITQTTYTIFVEEGKQKQWIMLQSIIQFSPIFKLDNATEAISSATYKLCFCETSSEYSNCSRLNSVEAYRGQKFSVFLLATVQGDLVTSTTVTAITSNARLKSNQTQQRTSDNCTEVGYNLFSVEENEELILYADGPCRDTGLARVAVNVTFLPCPDGFSQSGEKCTCEERLQVYNITCIIEESAYININESNFWMKVLYVNESYQGLILCKTCPADYCKTESPNVTLDDPDAQCDNHHSGVLCGACEPNHSLLLGGSHCQVCSNAYLGLLAPFAAAGVVLVAFLSLLRLTVATGMINSILLYANMVQANRMLIFPSSVNILTVFVAWLNLDLGFQTCFYDGMDAYTQTWLQFAFPAYVWVLISIIILTSRYSVTVTKLVGSNPVAVLATLLLMSYAKILKIIIDVYSFADLEYPGNKTVTVWLKDANVPYLQSKHLLLTTVATLVLFFLFLPYTLLLILGHKLYRFTGRRYLRWLRVFKPLLDAYYAPYRIKTRYWTGFLLLVRCCLYIVFSLNSLGDTNKSLLAIIVAFTGLVVIAWLSVSLYESFYVNLIEASIYLNIIALSAAVLSNSNSPALVYSLVGIVFATTVGVVTYHAYLTYISKSARWLALRGRVTRLTTRQQVEEAEVLLEVDTPTHNPGRIVSQTVVEFREPILDDQSSENQY